jgi:THO complex subunit 3
MIPDKNSELDPSHFVFPQDKCYPKEFKGHKDRILDLAFNVDGGKLGSTSGDTKIIIWNLIPSSFEKSVELKGHNDFVEKISWHPENENI